MGLTLAIGRRCAAARLLPPIHEENSVCWEDLSATKLYEPLGMASTSSRFADFETAPNRAWAHVRDNGQWVAKYVRQPDAQSPAGGVSSTARDMAQWLRLQPSAGTVDGKELDLRHGPRRDAPAADRCQPAQRVWMPEDKGESRR